MADVAMPRLSDSMEEGTILKWLKSDGDQVKRGEELVEIETDKANMTYEADQDGVLKIVAQEGDTLPVGETIASIGAAAEGGGGDGGAPAAPAQEQPAAEQPQEPQPAAQQPAAEQPAQQPAAQQPAAEQPAPQPAAEQPQQPAAEQPQQPAAEQPAQQPAAQEQPQQPAAAEQPRQAAEQPQQPAAAEAQQPAAAEPQQPAAVEPQQPAAAEPQQPAERPQQPAAAEPQQPAEQPQQPAAEEPQPAAAEQPRQPAPEPDEPEEAEDAGEGDADGNGRIKASPVARRMAREMGLELARLEGSGPGGRIVKADVEAAAKGGGAEAPAATPQPAPAEATAEAAVEAPAREEPAPQPPPEQPAEKPREVPAPVVSGDGQQAGKGDVGVEDLSRLQQTIARRMAESKATAPEFVLNADVDMEDAVSLRKQLKAAAGDQPAPSFNDFVIKAAALALREFPRANGAYRDGRFELYSRVNVGVAVAGQDALVVPTVFDADQKSLGQIARDARALAERVRAGAITPPELSSGTFTVSNLGMFGIDSFVAVINPPQAAILAVGALKPTPVVRDGEVTVRSIMRITLSCDHRILYGADAAQFLSRIRERLEQPLLLVL